MLPGGAHAGPHMNVTHDLPLLGAMAVGLGLAFIAGLIAARRVRPDLAVVRRGSDTHGVSAHDVAVFLPETELAGAMTRYVLGLAASASGQSLV